MTDSPADIALLARILNGDANGLAALIDRHWIAVVRYSNSILHDQDLAEDVAQEVFIRLWEHRESWGLEGSVCGLLFRIARNLSLDERRRVAARERAVTHLPEQNQNLSPSQQLENRELRQAIEMAVDDLPVRRREVFLLVRHHGLSYREAAEVLGLSTQTVANHLSLAMVDLRESLRARLDEVQEPATSFGGTSSLRIVGGSVGA